MLLMSNKSDPAGIGQETAKYRIVETVIECPRTVSEIVDEVRNILGFGNIGKLVLAVGEPIYFTRYVKSDAAPYQDLPTEGSVLVEAVRTAENMVEIPPGNSPETLLRMLSAVFADRSKPGFFLVRSFGVLKRWIGSGVGVVDWAAPFGAVPIQHEDMPEGAIALCGVPLNENRPTYGDVSVVALTHIDTEKYKGDGDDEPIEAFSNPPDPV
jgi:hypothetical protein